MRARLKRAAVEMAILRRNLTKTALARLTGLHRTHLSDLLAGRTAPGPQTRQRLLDVLGGDFDDCFEITRDHERSPDEGRVQQLLETRYSSAPDDPAGPRSRLLRLRDMLRAGRPLPAADRIWLGIEGKSARAARGAGFGVRAPCRRGCA
jgi:transcriptional regulator with XRE-family HTH domain